MDNKRDTHWPPCRVAFPLPLRGAGAAGTTHPPTPAGATTPARPTCCFSNLRVVWMKWNNSEYVQVYIHRVCMYVCIRTAPWPGFAPIHLLRACRMSQGMSQVS